MTIQQREDSKQAKSAIRARGFKSVKVHIANGGLDVYCEYASSVEIARDEIRKAVVNVIGYEPSTINLSKQQGY